MTQSSKETLEIKDLSKGMNTYDPETAVPEGYYVDAQNMLLTDKSPATIGGLTKLTTTPAPDSRKVLWFEPFSSPTTGAHSDTAHSDVAHSDVAHTDVAHADVAHGDVAHGDVAHSDVAHSDTHSDVAHSDTHSDVAHSDSETKGSHSDSPHGDSHSDSAHSDTHSDVAHSDSHTDSHSDSAHSDTAHSDVAHTDVAHSDVAHSDTVTNATLIVALDRGANTDNDGSGIWEYNPNNDTWSHLWSHAIASGAEARYRTVPPYYSSVPFRGRMIWSTSMLNNGFEATNDAAIAAALTAGTILAFPETGYTVASGDIVYTNDNPLKHDGRYVLPVGAAGFEHETKKNQRVATFETDETWTGGSTFVSTGGNRKDFNRSIQFSGVTGVAGVSFSDIDYAAAANGGVARDFQTGLLGAPNFGTADRCVMWFKRTAGAGAMTVNISFGTTNAFAAFFLGAYTFNPTNDVWYEISLARAAFTVGAGAPAWNNIGAVRVGSGTNNMTFLVDAIYWQYHNRPTARAAVVEVYNNQLMLGDLYDAKTTVKFSNVGTPDYVDPTIGIARFDGGRLTLGEQDRITSLWSYFDELIVGKLSSSWTFSGAGANVSISALPLTIGIAGGKAIVETPWSLHYFYDNNIFGARLTSRGLVSTNINSHLETIDITAGHRITTIRNDASHTVRWSLRTQADTTNQNGLGLLYDYQLDAWLSRYTQKVSHYTQWLNYTAKSRQILLSQYDGHIRIADLGTSFDGTAIESWVTLPWKQNPNPQNQMNIVQWMDAELYLRGTANVLVEARFADDPHEFDAATYSTYGTVLATPDGDKGYVQFGRTSRWMQLRLRATSLAFTVDLPIVIGFNSRPQRV